MVVQRWFSARRAALAAALLLLAPRAAFAQEDRVEAYRMSPAESDAMRVDGRLSEAVWSLAPALGDFRQREPYEGEPATERTEVRVAYDGATLYVGMMAYDSEPDRVVARLLQRDKLMALDFFEGGLAFAGDDAVALLLDPFHDHRNGVVFATNANGAEFDASVSDEGGEINIDWRGVWEVAGMRTAEGWSAEFAIPWRTLRYPDAAPDASWGLNVYRIIRRKNEQTYWQSWRREGGGFQRVSRAGHLHGLEDLPRQGLNLETKPFALTGGLQEVDDFGVRETSPTLEVGLDLKTELRPGLLLDLTANTDFAQVEVDDAQVNLTRFSLFFPEKRDFFLENSGIFDFGVPGNPFEPPPFVMFFSRVIGISDDGEVPILGGGRLTGRVGGQTVGLMNVLTGRAYGLPRESFSVGRVKRDVGESGYVGAMVTDRRSSAEWNTAAGVDGQFVLGEAWVWDWYAAKTFTEGAGGDGYSYRVGYNYMGENWGSFFNFMTVGPEANAKSGFILRDDYRQTDLFGRRRVRPSFAGVRYFDVWAGARYAMTVRDHRMQDWQAGVAIGPTFESGDNFNVGVNFGETVVDSIFDLTDDVSVPKGRYRADHIAFFGVSSPARWVSLSGNGILTRFHGGTLLSAGATLTAAPSAKVSLALGYTRNDVDIPAGAFQADISSLRASYSFSTRLSTHVLVQYNSLDSAFSTNVRFNFIHRPGSDFFVVFTENRGDEGPLWSLSQRGLVMKLTYLARM